MCIRDRRKAGSPQSPGTGLGLTISKFLADIMGGEISVHSTPGEGSTFKLSLMLPSLSEPLLQAAPARKIITYTGDRKTIMVVDDDASHRGLLSEILSPVGFTVLESADAIDCLNSCTNVKIDLFLLDISMPGMNGWELLKTMREQNITTPAIMVSADATETPHFYSDTSDTMKLNDDYIVKPIRDSILLDKVARVLQLQWHYEINDVTPVNNKTDTLNRNNTNTFDGIRESDFQDAISFAEIGYIQGLQDLLDRIDQDGGSKVFVAEMRDHLSQFQFEKIISIARKALS